MDTKENLEHINNAVAEVSAFINNTYLPMVDNAEDSVIRLRGFLNIITANSEAMQHSIIAMSISESVDDKLKARVAELENDLAIKTNQYTNLNSAYKQALDNIKVLESNAEKKVDDNTQILSLDLDADDSKDVKEVKTDDDSDVIASLDLEEDTEQDTSKDYTLELINKLKYELSDTKLALLKSNKEVGILTDDSIKLKGLINDYKIQLAALKSQTDLELLSNKILGFVELVSEKLSSTNSSIESLNSNLEKTNVNSEDSIAILKSQVKNIADVCVEIKELKSGNTKLITELEKQSNDVNDIKDTISETDEKLSSIAVEVDDNKNKTDSLATDLKDTKQEINKKLSFLDKLKRLVGND